MRLAYVVPRYGPDVVGGAETLVREEAERLSARGHAVEVLTTCARDHHTWRNELPAGETVQRGVRIRRFPVTLRPDAALMTSLHARMVNGFALDADAATSWVRNAGLSEPLLDALPATGDRVDALLFAPYLFASTVFGVAMHPENSLVIPCLHDEPYARFAPVLTALRAGAGLIFNTRAEANLAATLSDDLPRHRVVGIGVELPPGRRDPAGFRTRRGLQGDLLTWAGRREGAKNFPLLMEWTALHGRALAPEHPAMLVALGEGPIRVPAAARGLVADLGTVDEPEKLDAMAAAVAVAQLSVHESFSLAIMEGWLCGTPCIVHAGCAVTREHCARSGGGLWVESAEEFSAALSLLQTDAALRGAMGAAGRRYVETEYAWPAVLDRLEAAITDLVGLEAR